MERVPLHPVDDLVTLGSDYGGWTLPGQLIDASWVCYSVGAGGDISFDLELIRRYEATVRAVEPVSEYVERARRDALGESRFTIHQAALTRSDGPLRMQVTHDPASKSVSPAALYDSDSYVELPGRSLPSLMAQFGDSRIDLLKMDIEGGEYEVIPTLDLRTLGVRILATQLHHVASVREARGLVRGLADQGYEPVARRPAVKLAFLRDDLLRRTRASRRRDSNP